MTVYTTHHLVYHPPTVYHPGGHYSKILNDTRVITRRTVYTTPPEVMPHTSNHYDIPKLSQQVKACRDQLNEYRYRHSTAAAHQVRESTAAYRMETSSMEVEKVQSRASVVHRNGENMSAAQTIAAVPGSIAPFFYRRSQTRSVPPGAEAFTAGHAEIPATASVAAVRTTVPVPADVPATAPDAEAFTLLAACLECGGENLQTLQSHPLLSPPRLLGCLEYGSKTCL